MLRISRAGKTRDLASGRDVYISTVRNVSRVQIENAPLVFAGYGVSAPERQWDDYNGTDVRDKVVVVLVNDPDFKRPLTKRSREGLAAGA